jgi:hypothetical protein
MSMKNSSDTNGNRTRDLRWVFIILRCVLTQKGEDRIRYLFEMNPSYFLCLGHNFSFSALSYDARSLQVFLCAGVLTFSGWHFAVLKCHLWYTKHASILVLFSFLEANIKSFRVEPRRVWSRSFLRRVRKIAESDYSLRHVCLSVRLHGTTRLPLDGFSWNYVYEYFTKNCAEN